MRSMIPAAKAITDGPTPMANTGDNIKLVFCLIKKY